MRKYPGNKAGEVVQGGIRNRHRHSQRPRPPPFVPSDATPWKGSCDNDKTYQERILGWRYRKWLRNSDFQRHPASVVSTGWL